MLQLDMVGSTDYGCAARFIYTSSPLLLSPCSAGFSASVAFISLFFSTKT